MTFVKKTHIHELAKTQERHGRNYLKTVNQGQLAIWTFSFQFYERNIKRFMFLQADKCREKPLHCPQKFSQKENTSMCIKKRFSVALWKSVSDVEILLRYIFSLRVRIQPATHKNPLLQSSKGRQMDILSNLFGCHGG